MLDEKEIKRMYEQFLRLANKERYKERRRQHYLRHKEKIIAETRQWALANPEKRRKIGRDWARKHPEKLKKWLAKNPDKRRAIVQRYDSKPMSKLRHRLRSRLRFALRSMGLRKQKSCLEFLGCTLKEFKQHIESLFTSGMSWDNCGQWHLDHIKPLAKFDLTNETDQRMAFHYTNIQPLWAIDNLRKGAS